MVGGTCIVFKVSTLWCSLDQHFVRRILPLPALDQPPGLPAAIQGTFDLAGTTVPVLRLDRLFGLTPSPSSIYNHLILCGGEGPPLALLVDLVSHVLSVPESRISTLAEGETLNGCVVGRFQIGLATVHMLDGERLLDQRERQMLADFQAEQQQRHDSLEAHRA
jgi:purine-binding chemotaxis protein CheW